MNVYDVNRQSCLVDTERLGRTNGPRHNRTFPSGGPTFLVKEFKNVFSPKTRVCLVQVLSNSLNRAIRQEVRMFIDGTTPTQNMVNAGQGHVLKERQNYYLNVDLVSSAKFCNNIAVQSEQIKLVVTELTV